MTKYNNSRPDYERDLTPVDYRSLVLACEYGLDEGKLRHINVPKHDWELVCDGSREEIERIVKEVMETGVDGIPQGNGVFVKYKLINGHFVVVLYIIHNAQRRVSTAFVCKPKLEKKYIPGRTQNENC